jgi:hypothetical protein
MATDLQHKALDTLVEAGRTKKRIIKGQVLVKAGYSKNTAIAPDKVFKSVGFLALCDEIGLTDNFLAKALYNDIKGKPKKREKELRLAFQIKQKLVPETNGNTTNILNILAPEQAERIARRILNGDAASKTALD